MVVKGPTVGCEAGVVTVDGERLSTQANGRNPEGTAAEMVEGRQAAVMAWASGGGSDRPSMDSCPVSIVGRYQV